MFIPDTSTAQVVTVNATGDVKCRIGVLDAGTPEATIALKTGDTVIHLRDINGALDTLELVWRAAHGLEHRLPWRDTSRLPGGAPGLYRVASLVVIQGRTAAMHTFLPATRRTPKHIRVQFGPVVWRVTDLLAMRAISTAVERAHQIARPLREI
ncbi:hypothetical protein ACFFR6_17830 [Saccharothrix mutabilis subsp. capreolus]|uniref:hypothetical protein n=1 Tax=Saccharothrix mutabilis TaxID=33921 RepID=UPI0035EB50D7|nr:hypothetical protein GCM10017745_30590 [Saccharothrix mutabilis subsp. capreolus]